MWQRRQLADLLHKGLRTVARLALGLPTLHGHCFAHRYPCRIVFSRAYDTKGCYTGPLPSAKCHGAMFHNQARGAFKTTGSEQWPAEQWPAKLCQWLSAMLLSSCMHAANAAVGEGVHAGHEETLLPNHDTFPLNQVGTFGLSCASYWWTRIAACGLRLTYHLPKPLTLPTMVRVLCGWVADRLQSGGRPQKPEPLLEGAAP